MAFLRWIWLALGLAMVFAGGTAATMGYFAARDAKSRPELVVVSAPVKQPTTTKKAPANATTRKASAKFNLAAKRKVASTTRRSTTTATPTPATAPTTRTTVTAANPNLTAAAARKWRGMMWWGGGALVLGLASVVYSLHELRPKAPPTGADELLNDAPPF